MGPKEFDLCVAYLYSAIEIKTGNDEVKQILEGKNKLDYLDLPNELSEDLPPALHKNRRFGLLNVNKIMAESYATWCAQQGGDEDKDIYQSPQQQGYADNAAGTTYQSYW